MNYSYQEASASDRKVIYDLYSLIMREFITEIWGWNEEWQVNDFDNCFIPENITLVYKKGDLVGYSQVETLNKKIHLRMLAIHPANQGNGVGTELLRLFLSYNQSQKSQYSLDVFKINTIARLFYEKNGFVVESETSSSYVMKFNKE